MKKGLFSSGIIFVLSLGIVLGEGCFHDAIEVVDEPGIVTQGARVRNVACMLGSEVLATLKAGTKVRIIGKTAWTKIVMPDGKVGWIGNSYIKTSDSWSGVPSMPKNHVVDCYCDTTNTSRCPNPAGVGEVPTFYTDDSKSTNTSTSTTSTSTTVASNPAMDDLLDQFYTSLDNKYGDDEVKKSQAIQGVIKALNMLKRTNPKLKSLIEYLVVKLSEKL